MKDITDKVEGQTKANAAFKKTKFKKRGILLFRDAVSRVICKQRLQNQRKQILLGDKHPKFSGSLKEITRGVIERGYILGGLDVLKREARRA